MITDPGDGVGSGVGVGSGGVGVPTVRVMTMLTRASPPIGTDHVLVR